MKKLIFILFVLVSFTSFAQNGVYQKMPLFGYGPIQRLDVDSLFTFTTICGTPKLNSVFNNQRKKKAAIAYDSCNAKFYVFNPKDSSWSTLNDSTTFVPYNEYGIKSGGEVRRLTGNNYEITTVYYTIEGVNYRALTDTVTLNSYADSAQVAGIFANTAQVISVRYSAKSSQPAFPAPVPTEDVLVAYVLISDTGNAIFTPTADTNWVRNGNDLFGLFSGNLYINSSVRAAGGFNTNTQFTNSVFSGIRQSVPNTFDLITGDLRAGRVSLVGTGTGGYLNIDGPVNPSSGTGLAGMLSLSSTYTPAASNSKKPFGLNIAPTYNYTSNTTDTIFGIRYSPTISGSLNGTPHVGLFIETGDIVLKSLAITSDTVYKPLGINSTGQVRKLSFWPTGSGGGGGTPTLDQVTTAGNTTNNPATFGSLTGSTLESSTSLSVGTSASIGTNISAQSADIDWRVSTDTLNLNNIQLLGDSRLTIATASGIVDIISPDAGGTAQLDAIDITGTKNFKFQDKSGTLAFLSDISDSTKNFYVYSPLVVRDTTDGYVVEIDPDSLAAWRPVSGTYTPTASIDANVDAAVPTKAFYTKTGSIVTVFGMVDITTGLISNGVGEFNITLPIESAITSDDISGVANYISAGFKEGVIISRNNKIVTFTYETLEDNVPTTIYYSYQYEILYL